MHPIDEVFRRKAERRWIPFIMAGDPDRESTLEMIRLLEEEGASAVELGVPFSDPLADGPVIQEASARALSGGMNLAGVLDLAREARSRDIRVPLVLFTYVNPVLRYGPEALIRDAADSGIHGMIIPDLPWEEGTGIAKIAEEAGIYLIPLVAPTSRERVRRIVAGARGFVYCVSSLGTTGVRRDFSEGVEDFLDTVRRWSPVPTAVGFGISRKEHVDRFMAHADAVVVGSALVRVIHRMSEKLCHSSTRPEGLEGVRTFVRELKGSSATGM